MGENDFDKESKKITKQAVQARKQELAEEKQGKGKCKE